MLHQILQNSFISVVCIGLESYWSEDLSGEWHYRPAADTMEFYIVTICLTIDVIILVF